VKERGSFVVGGGLREIRCSNSCSVFSDDEFEELKSIAKAYVYAAGPFMKLAGLAGRATDSVLRKLPAGWEQQVQKLSSKALETAYDAVLWASGGKVENGTWMERILAWANGERWHRLATAFTGALGGSGGIGSTALELPVTTAFILRTIQEIAKSYGEDPADESVRQQCILVFGLGSPLGGDEAEIGFWEARFAIGKQTIPALLRSVAPRFGITASEKFLAQAAPLVGAAGGALINYTFAAYYQKMAHVHFRLRAIGRKHDPDQVRSCVERLVKYFSGQKHLGSAAKP
jgi:EcsC protein family